jgi:hypothetical protein
MFPKVCVRQQDDGKEEEKRKKRFQNKPNFNGKHLPVLRPNNNRKLTFFSSFSTFWDIGMMIHLHMLHSVAFYAKNEKETNFFLLRIVKRSEKKKICQ